MPLTVEQVSTLAPDASALAAGKKTADPRGWTALGQSAAALWGECKGSAVYQVRVALGDFSSKCSCPSRKFPCKHALGLMFLGAQDPARVPAGEPPDWVAEWLAKRDESADKKKDKAAKLAEKLAANKGEGQPAQAEAGSATSDPKAQAKRAEKRTERVLAGVEALDLWMRDLARTGLAAVTAKGDQPWREQAARLVDAQGTGLASRLKQLAALPRSAPDFHERLADGLGRVALLTHAVRRVETLEPALAADVRQGVGWTLEREEVITTGERLSDEWSVIGQVIDDEDRVRVQRTWLRGRASGRYASVVQFAVGSARFAETLPPGTIFDGELAFWPSAFPVRALVSVRTGELRPFIEPAQCPMEFREVEDMLTAHAEALARQPWLDRFPCAMNSAVPSLVDAASGQFGLVDQSGRSVALTGAAGWRLFAQSGGHPVDLFGEWDGRALLPLGLWTEGKFFSLGTGSAGA